MLRVIVGSLVIAGLILVYSFPLLAGPYLEAGINTTRDRTQGAGFHLGVGLFSFSRITPGIATDISVSGLTSNPFGLYSEISNLSDSNDALSVGKTISRSSVYSAAYVSFDVDIIGGLYLITGLGYGVHYKGRSSAYDLLKVANDFEEASSSSESLDNVVEDQEFLNSFEDLSSDLLVSLIESIYEHPNSLTAQVDSTQKVTSLVNEPDALTGFLKDLSASSTKSDGFDNVLCDLAVDCSKGVAYQLGVGYAFPLFPFVPILKWNIYGKMQGLFSSENLFSAGVNLRVQF